MTNLLDVTDWEILLEYDRDPFQSYNAISKKVGVHHTTVADRISTMKTNMILRPDGKYVDTTRDDMVRPTSEVIGSYSPASLGLERIHVLFKKVASVEDYNKLHNFCSWHPYTHYIARLYGSGVTLYTQFDIPKDTFDIHQKTFTEVAEEYVNVEPPTIYRDTYEARAVPNYQMARSYERKKSVNIIEKLWNEFLEQRKSEELKVPTKERKIDNIDAELIRELTINGKTKLVDLTDYFELNKSTISRRVARIRENNVSTARLVFGPKADQIIGFNNTQIVTGTFQNDSELKDEFFIKFINSDNILPFEAFITVDGNRFFLYTQASIGVAGDLMEFLYQNTNPFSLNQYQFYISNSISYPFYHGNYREDEGFITSPEYIRDNELARLENKMN